LPVWHGKIGSGSKVCIGMDPWVGSGKNHIISPTLIVWLRKCGYNTLAHIINLTHTSIWCQGWWSAIILELVGGLCREWTTFLNALHTTHIRLLNE